MDEKIASNTITILFMRKSYFTLLLGVFDIAKESSENSAFLKKCHLKTNIL